jgi:hypothetical protein
MDEACIGSRANTEREPPTSPAYPSSSFTPASWRQSSAFCLSEARSSMSNRVSNRDANVRIMLQSRGSGRYGYVIGRPDLEEWAEPSLETCELRFKIVRIETAGHEVLGRLSNLIVARAAFDVSVSLWPSAWIELRQDARVIEKHGARG